MTFSENFKSVKGNYLNINVITMYLNHVNYLKLSVFDVVHTFIWNLNQAVPICYP